MADLKFQQLTLAVPVGTDIFPFVSDPAGVPLDKKTTFSGALSALGGIGGSIASTQIAFGTGVNTIGGSANITWTNSTQELHITATPTIIVGDSYPVFVTSEVTPTAISSATYSGGVFAVQNSSAFNMTGSVVGLTGASVSDAVGTTLAFLGGGSFSSTNIAGTTTLQESLIIGTGVIGGTVTTAVGAHIYPFTGGGTVTNATSLRVDPPGVGTTAKTLSVGTGASFIEGNLNVGTATDAASIQFNLVQAAGSASGGLTAFKVTGGAHLNNTNVEFNDVYFDLSRDVNLVGGGGAISQMRGFVIDAANYTADAAQSIEYGFNTYINGGPTATGNVTLTGSVALGIGTWSGTSYYNLGTIFDLPGLANGVGATVANIALLVGNFGNTINFSNQTATTDLISMLRVDAATIDSDTNIRTFTDAPTAEISGIFSYNGVGSDITITNGPHALKVSGAGTIKNIAGSITHAIDIPNYTITMGTNTQVTSVGPAGLGIGIIDVANGLGAVTVDNASALYLAGAPTFSGAVTLSNSYTIWSDGGPNRFDGNVIMSSKIIEDGTTTSSGAGAVAVTGSIHEITTTGVGNALTLADGTEGQRLVIVYVAESAGADTAVLTPSNMAGGTTVTFSVIGQRADGVFTAGKWFFIAQGAVIA